MTAELGPNRYGKSAIRLVRVDRRDEGHRGHRHEWIQLRRPQDEAVEVGPVDAAIPKPESPSHR